MNARREQDLCFNCDDKYHKNLKSKAKTLILLREQDSMDLEEEDISTDQIEEAALPQADEGTISYHALSRHMVPKTIWFKWTINGCPILILVD